MIDLKSFQIALLAWGAVFCLILLIAIRSISALDKKSKNIYTFLLFFTFIYLLTDCLAWYYRGMIGHVGYIGVRVSNGLNFIFDYLLIGTFHILVCYSLFNQNLSLKRKLIRVKLVYIICVIGILMVFVNHFTGFLYYFDQHNLYHRGPYSLLYAYTCFLIVIIDLSLLVQYGKNLDSKVMLFAMIAYLLLPLFAGFLQSMYYGMSLYGISVSISTIAILCTELVNTSQKLLKKEKEASEMKVALTLSQIAPHFIYNTLTTIKRLCVKDPELAQDTITNFSNYLRANIDSIEQKEPILFSKELEHVKNYIFVEHLRFGDKINVVYDIKDDDFKLPALSLQVLVENAIKHGICKKEEGGTIKISTYSDDTNYYLKVEDNGVGFDYLDLNNYHIGLNSTISRLKTLCNATLKIESARNIGTKVMMSIPKEGV